MCLQVSVRVNPPESDWRPTGDAGRREAAADAAAPDDMAELNDLLYTRDELMNRCASHIVATMLLRFVYSTDSVSVREFYEECHAVDFLCQQTVQLQSILSLRRILEEEDNLIAAHRWQIEETMAIVRQEMNLLGQVQHGLFPMH